MHKTSALLFIIATISTCSCGVLFTSPSLISATFQNSITPGIVPAPVQDQSLAHPAVVENAIAESQLPPNVLNPFYKDPIIAAGLAKESWFANKEFPVHHREAEKIPREQIYKLVHQLQLTS